MGSFTRHKLIDYCIDASEMKSREKTPRSVPHRCAAAALPLFCQSAGPACWTELHTATLM